MLDTCTPDSRWQLSLVHAIESASPLPAPADTQLFAPTVTLDFQSATYSATSNHDGFAPELAMNVEARADAAPAGNPVLDTLRTLPTGSGVIDLKIVGSHASAVRSEASAPVTSPDPEPTP